MIVDLADPNTDLKKLWHDLINGMGKHDVIWDGQGRFIFEVLMVGGWLTEGGNVSLDRWPQLKENAELLLEAWVQCGILERIKNDHNPIMPSKIYVAVDNEYVGDILVRNGMIQRGTIQKAV